MKKQLFLFFLCIAIGYNLIGMANTHNEVNLLFNMSSELFMVNNNFSPSKNFRTTESFDDLYCSGSGQITLFDINMLKNIITERNVYIVDLRQESHAFFENEAICWRNKANNSNENQNNEYIEQDERNKCSELLGCRVEIYPENKYERSYAQSILIKNAYTEQEACQRAGIFYLRIPVQDHNAPTVDQVDIFIQFIKQLPENSWLHFHCQHGQSRTTTFMIMYDMMLHAHELSFEEIVIRHHKIGGVNILTRGLDKKARMKEAIKRKQFVQLFYNYCQQNKETNFEKTYSTWLEQIKN